MANIKIAQLTNKTSLADTDLVIVESATQTMKMTIANLVTILRGLLGLHKNYIENLYIPGGTQMAFSIEEGSSRVFTFSTNTAGNYTQILVTRFPGFELVYTVIGQSSQIITIATNASKTSIYFIPTYSVRGFVTVSRV